MAGIVYILLGLYVMRGVTALHNLELNDNSDDMGNKTITLQNMMDKLGAIEKLTIQNVEANHRMQAELHQVKAEYSHLAGLLDDTNKKAKDRQVDNEKAMKKLEREISILDANNKDAGNWVAQVGTNEKQDLLYGNNMMEVRENSFISFTAYPTAVRTYNEDDRVLFDGIVRNYGSSYDESESVFVCPASAYYFFSIFVHSQQGTFWANLMVDGVVMVSVEAIGNYNAAGNSVITLCEEGQVVDVICTRNESPLYGGTDLKLRRSTFSGTLLRVK